MNLEDLRQLPIEDQVTMVVGVSVRHAVEMEAALRSVLMTLDPNFDPSVRRWFSDLVRAFRRQISENPAFSSEARSACLDIATEALGAYQHRSNNVHDMMSVYSDVSIERFRFERDHDVDFDREPETLSVEDLVQNCVDLMHATWRLRGVILYLQKPNERIRWKMLLNGKFEARWDGSASHIEIMR
ncbi:hypothetical protein [uncultured Microbacterium sp.]|uniref:hypothetical protein n=1 Tax=uncultured Microbacterium sp. TaxID=191216 RepID=UPI002626671E|nr:hypothetical protein [uncultured Microbacterium sp.]